MNSCERLLNEFHGTTFRDSDEIAKTFYIAGLRRAAQHLREAYDKVPSNPKMFVNTDNSELAKGILWAQANRIEAEAAGIEK